MPSEHFGTPHPGSEQFSTEDQRIPISPLFPQSIEHVTIDSPEAAQPIEAAKIEAMRQRHTQKLRQLRPFFQLIRKKEHLWDQVSSRLGHRDEFFKFNPNPERQDDFLQRGTLDPEDRIRQLVPLFSAAATVPEIRALFQAALNQASESESGRLLEAIKSGQNEVDFFMIGASVHGAKFNAELMANYPEASSLTVDKLGVLGGHWREYGDAVLRMNTENAAINENVEGQVDNLHYNSFGEHAPVQLPELSGDLHANSEIMGLATATNQYLSGNTLLNTEVVSVQRNLDLEQSARPFKVELQVGEETHEIYTNWVTFASGLGKSDYGLRNPDEETQRILAQYGSLETNPAKQRIEVYAEHLANWGDEANIYPREKYKDKRVMVVGGGHSGWTVIQNLIGDGPESRGSVASLGGPQKIVVAGSKYASSEEFKQEELEVYAAVARVYPNTESAEDQRQALVDPLKGAKVFKIEQVPSVEGEPAHEDDPFLVYYTVPETVMVDGKEVTQTVVKTEEVDNIIFTTGFKNTTNEILRQFLDSPRKVIPANESADPQLQQMLETAGSIIYFNNAEATGVKALEVLAASTSDSNQTLRYRIVEPNGQSRVVEGELDPALLAQLNISTQTVEKVIQAADEGKSIETVLQQPEAIARNYDYLCTVTGAVFSYNPKCQWQRIEVGQVSGRRNDVSVAITQLGQDGAVVENSLTPQERAHLLASLTNDLQGIDLPPVAKFPDHLPFVYDGSDSGYPIARSVPGSDEQIICVGPAAGLSTNERELKQAAMHRGHQNQVAIVNNQETASCARKIASACQVLRETQQYPVETELRLQEPQPMALPAPENAPASPLNFTVAIAPENAVSGVASKVDYTEQLSMHVRTELLRYAIPAQIEALSFTVQRASGENGDAPGFQVSTQAALPEEYQAVIESLFSSDSAQRLLYRLTDKRYTTSDQLTITIPTKTPLRKESIEL